MREGLTNRGFQDGYFNSNVGESYKRVWKSRFTGWWLQFESIGKWIVREMLTHPAFQYAASYSKVSESCERGYQIKASRTVTPIQKLMKIRTGGVDRQRLPGWWFQFESKWIPRERLTNWGFQDGGSNSKSLNQTSRFQIIESGGQFRFKSKRVVQEGANR